ncbi:AAA family ATPase [Methylobacterium sp. WL30]|uniref:AAA family ATPase n=1 Tax=unclassified Methylobacterium TaxID=2615210 RepID=UPI0011CAF285|nr:MULTISPECIES: ATP-binding protein [unclassified Methylobacterium]TXN38744.1 AAA family ATPase [Methylobacterium sp. WL93]TXN52238.1 AAA family ATPase [Methylobacterium sp. WL119]TXN70679.1 AAA family ATPase [Methylobacterium sp. WL30]
MKIVQLQAENVKRLRAVSIEPDGNIVEITGRNGQGKSSVLDAIWWALSGTTHIQAVPIRKGENEARIRLDLGEIKVVRTFKKREDETFATTLVVESEEGARYPSPQKMLDALLGALSFDPLAFTRMDGKAQMEALKRFVPGVDFAAIEKANKEDFDRRTAWNRDARTLRSQAAGIEIPADAPAERVDDAALVAEMERAGEQNALIERRRANREAAAAEVKRLDIEAERIRAEIAALNDRLRDAEGSADQKRGQLANAETLPKQIDTAALRERIADAGRVNALVARREERARIEARAAEAEATSAALTKAMDERTAAKREAIAKADLPVPGIEFGDDEILLDGVPFDQASSAEQLRTSVAIAMAANPKLRVIRVQDGSLLDEEAMRILAEMAQASDYQVWIEVVQSGRSAAIVIEDGAVRGTMLVAAAE